jgi:hypothetical protein
VLAIPSFARVEMSYEYMYDSPIRMQTSAMRAAGPSLEMFRMKARGISTATWIAIIALVERGLSPPAVTASEHSRVSVIH